MIYIFTKKWQEESMSSGFLNLALIGILFAVGWTISGLIAKLLMEPKGLGLQFTRDTFSLTLLTIAEYFFYKFYYKEESTSNDTETQ